MKAKPLRFKSKFEQEIAVTLEQRGIEFIYEPYTLSYQKPPSRYTPDFLLPFSGVLIETKGRFLSSDRTKHLLLKHQYPELDLRFIFQNAYQKLTPNSPTTYANWCENHGFLFSHRFLPKDWT